MSAESSRTESDERSPFERFEDMARRIVTVPRQDVPMPKPTPRPTPAASGDWPEGAADERKPPNEKQGRRSK